MNRIVAALFAAVLFVGVGCQNGNTGGDGRDAMPASADACPHCEGVQKANADGKCPACEAKAKGVSDAGADACSHCPGVQTATADGKCSACGMEVAGN